MQLGDFKVGDKVWHQTRGSVSKSRYHTIVYIGRVFVAMVPEKTGTEHLFPAYDQTWELYHCENCGK